MHRTAETWRVVCCLLSLLLLHMFPPVLASLELEGYSRAQEQRDLGGQDTGRTVRCDELPHWEHNLIVRLQPS